MDRERESQRFKGDPSIDLTLEVGAPVPADVALDIGCGVGAMSFALAAVVTSVKAVDDRQEAIDEARRLTGEVGVTNVEFSVVNLYALPFPEASFDLAVCRNAIHRFAEPAAALREAARVLAPGGRLVVYDMVVTDAVDRHLNELARLADSSHRRHCRREEFLEQFDRAGLRVATETADRRTVDLAYWLEAGAVDADRSELIRMRLQELPLKVQTALDLAVADRLASFSYDVACFRLERA